MNRMKQVGLCGVATVTTLLTTPGVAANATAEQRPWRYRNVETGQCLESEGRRVYTDACGRDRNQFWRLEPRRGETYWVRNTQSENCLTTEARRRVTAERCEPRNDSQRWRVIRHQDGSVSLRNEGTDSCLAARERGRVYTAACDRRDRSQRWQ
jgi:hypothetical protein